MLDLFCAQCNAHLRIVAQVSIVAHIAHAGIVAQFKMLRRQERKFLFRVTSATGCLVLLYEQ